MRNRDYSVAGTLTMEVIINFVHCIMTFATRIMPPVWILFNINDFDLANDMLLQIMYFYISFFYRNTWLKEVLDNYLHLWSQIVISVNLPKNRFVVFQLVHQLQEVVIHHYCTWMERRLFLEVNLFAYKCHAVVDVIWHTFLSDVLLHGDCNSEKILSHWDLINGSLLKHFIWSVLKSNIWSLICDICKKINIVMMKGTFEFVVSTA